MNFLAHIYLSGNYKLLRIGNFSADGIKGKHYLNYPKPVQVGVLLHRAIDTFTDTNPIVKQSTKRLHKNYSHYSSVIVDLFYDHFLAKNWTSYHEIPLEDFIESFYNDLKHYHNILPESYQGLVDNMIAGNWLYSYASLEGMQRVLNGMNKRTKGKSLMHKASTELSLYYDSFESEFTDFFKVLKKFSDNKRFELLKQFNL
jgi:acyl carrier protein phosphodiesterase